MNNGLKTTQLDALIMGDAVMMLRDIGRQLRRVKSKDTRDKNDLRCVWHQSKLRTELSSWETPTQEIVHQEFCFFGQVVEYRKGEPVRTGTIPNNATLSDAKPTAAGIGELYKPHRHPEFSLLEAASTILRECPKRDYFTQHMLKQVNAALNASNKSVKRTQVLGLDMYQSLEQVMTAEGLVAKAAGDRPVTTKQKWAVIAIVTACALIGAVAFWAIVKR